ncbi:transmembrane emp24 domain containing protein [Echinococcus multilocularis]|uniref:Transmembrane emp24 domain containing protein n=1 Tax=Echinococcus multilocularis TaxID=6211 RepID=A0A068Y094_ECHMU|nr:transmembrane emp24 domain containing protein [Echinococcus multilocularis]
MNWFVVLGFSLSLTLFGLRSVFALSFDIKSGDLKCIHDEIDKDEIVVGNYAITDGPTSKVSIEVKDSKGHTFFQKSDATSGKFTFSSEVEDSFDVCFRCLGASGVVDTREVFIDIKQGDEAKNIDAIAQAKDLKPVEVELKKIEYFTDSIVRDFVAMHKRADAMRDINASTHSRVLYFSMFSILCLIALAVWQVLYLRSYFKSKKLIE